MEDYVKMCNIIPRRATECEDTNISVYVIPCNGHALANLSSQHHHINLHLRTMLYLAHNPGLSVLRELCPQRERVCVCLYECMGDSCLPAALAEKSEWSVPWNSYTGT